MVIISGDAGSYAISTVFPMSFGFVSYLLPWKLMHAPLSTFLDS